MHATPLARAKFAQNASFGTDGKPRDGVPRERADEVTVACTFHFFHDLLQGDWPATVNRVFAAGEPLPLAEYRLSFGPARDREADVFSPERAHTARKVQLIPGRIRTCAEPN